MTVADNEIGVVTMCPRSVTCDACLGSVKHEDYGLKVPDQLFAIAATSFCSLAVKLLVDITASA